MELMDFLYPQKHPIKIIDGIPSFVDVISGEDEKMNRFYEKIAPFYGFTERLFGKLILGIDMRTEWKKVADAAEFAKGSSILEVSPGSGVYQPYLREQIGPSGSLVSLDLSMGMLRACRRKKEFSLQNPLLVHGNGSDLPFRDGVFDGVFHVGGINLFSEPEKAVLEFARVVKKGGRVVIGDEGFSSGKPSGIRRKILTKMNPGYLISKVPALPDTLKEKSLEWYFCGCLYLIVAVRK
jgi:ubiquinone/menaquinone biosynthesis C-methylase UbiE